MNQEQDRDEMHVQSMKEEAHVAPCALREVLSPSSREVRSVGTARVRANTLDLRLGPPRESPPPRLLDVMPPLPPLDTVGSARETGGRGDAWKRRENGGRLDWKGDLGSGNA